MTRLAAFVLLLIAALSAIAQPYPSRSVKFVVPASAGGATDNMARSLAARLTEIWGQPVVVENRPGATQIIGAEHVAKSAPDGYTLLVSEAATWVITPHFQRKLPFDGMRDFTPVTVLVRFPWVIAVHASVPAGTFQELVAYARAKPGTLSYGSFGLGSSGHISVDYLKNLLAIDILHVPYKGAAPAVADLLAGQIQVMMVTPLLVEPHARAGKLKLLAAATRERISRLPDLPTVSESGVPGYEAGTWFALVGPAGMRPEVTNFLYTEVKRVMNEPAFRDKFVEKQWFEVVANTPDEFAAFLKSEYERWEKVIKLSGVKLE